MHIMFPLLFLNTPNTLKGPKLPFYSPLKLILTKCEGGGPHDSRGGDLEWVMWLGGCENTCHSIFFNVFELSIFSRPRETLGYFLDTFFYFPP